MDRPDLRALARHLDRMRRGMATYRPGVVVRDVPGGSCGWMMARPAPPGVEEGDLPTTCLNRVFMLGGDRPIGREDIAAALRIGAELGCRRVFFWLAPWLYDSGTEEAMRDIGAVPFVASDSIALARASGECPAGPHSDITVREILAQECPAVLDPVADWFSADGVNTGKNMIATGLAELFAAFAPGVSRAVAIGFLRIDGPFAYLFAAGTDPGHRRRGAQSALIRARVAAATMKGVAWSSCETNTTAASSLNNLRRCGFLDCIVWRGFRWDAAAMPAG